MTRDELARSIVKLPGFDAERRGMTLKFTDAASGGSAWEITVCDDTAKAVHEIVTESTYDGEPITEWWPDLTDAATGGCLQELAGWPPILSLFEVDEGRWVCVLSRIGYHISQRTGIGATRAEAVSIAICVWALALGRWPGGGS